MNAENKTYENQKKIKTQSRRESRNHIFNMIFQGEFHNLNDTDEIIKNYYDVLEAEELEEKNLSNDFDFLPLDKVFIESEIKGIAENIDNIDNTINKFCLGWNISRISKVDLAILRLSVYEILFRDDIPDSVSVNEAVELAKKYSDTKSPAFINGVLGSILKNKED